MPSKQLPVFYAELTARESTSARALQFIILTACRSGEVREARWGEVDKDVWTIPALRAKTRQPHRVPLPVEAVRVMGQMKGFDKDLIFLVFIMALRKESNWNARKHDGPNRRIPSGNRVTH